MTSPDTDQNTSQVTRRHLLATGGLGLGSALAGCLSLSGGNSENPDVLRFALPQPPVTLDPLARHDSAAALVVRQVAESLYRYNRQMQVTPLLAAGPPEVGRGGRRWIVELLPSATFQGDSTVVADDVVYSVREARRRGLAGAGSFQMLDQVVRIDDRTVQFDLAYDFGGFEDSLMTPIVPAPGSPAREATETGGTQDVDDSTRNLLGSGPFALGDTGQDGSIRLVSRDEYWRGDPAGISELEFRVIPEDTKRIVTLRGEEIDATQSVPPSVWQTLEDLEDVTLSSVAGYGYAYLAFNCAQGPTSHPDVRRAIDYAVNFEEVITNALGPSGTHIHGPLPAPITERWSFPTDKWRAIRAGLDIDRARSLLEDSEAVPPEWTFRIITPPGRIRHTICEAVVEGVQETGFEAEVVDLDWPTFRETYTTGNSTDYDAYCFEVIAGTDPDGIMYPLFGPNAPGMTDGTYYRDATEAVVRGRRESERGDRRGAYEDAAHRILEDVVHIPLFTRRQSVAKRSYVAGVTPHPSGGALLVQGDFNINVDDRE